MKIIKNLPRVQLHFQQHHSSLQAWKGPLQKYDFLPFYHRISQILRTYYIEKNDPALLLSSKNLFREEFVRSNNTSFYLLLYLKLNKLDSTTMNNVQADSKDQHDAYNNNHIFPDFKYIFLKALVYILSFVEWAQLQR